MENEPLNPSADPAQMILASQRGAVATAIGSLDADPEQAARSMELSQATGVPAPVINSNLEGFEEQHKAALTANLLNNNEYLQRFINSNAMTSKVANDDYANLDEVSQKVSGLQSWLKSNTIQQGFLRGFGDQPIGEQLAPPNETFGSDHKLAEATFRATMMIPDLALRALSGATFGATYGALGAEKGEAAGQALMDPGLQATLHGLGPPGVMAESVLAMLSKVRPAEQFLKQGRNPPPTLSADFDKAAAEHNAEGVDQLKEATSAAQQSALRERSPELFKQFIDQHTDAEIGVSGEVVAALYGDKLPTPDDGLLGWVPGIEDKLNLAQATGDDVSIPLSDWIAKVDPEVMKGLEDDIRVHPEGITKNEVKAVGEAEEARRDLHEQAQPEAIEGAEAPAPYKAAEPLEDLTAQTRFGSALEPLFSVGDRKLELARIGGDAGERLTPESLAAASGETLTAENRGYYENQAASVNAQQGKFGAAQGFHDFSINDEKGNPVGTLNISEQKGGKQLYVDMVNGIGGLGPRDFGPALMRSLLKQLKEEFPNAESITGHRVSGAREKAGSYMASSASPVVKLDALDTQSAHDALKQIFEGGKWEHYSSNLSGYIKPDITRTPQQRELVNILNDEFNRLAPNKARLGIADTIKADTSGLAGQRAGEDIRVGGAYVPYRDAYPIILAALDSDDAVGGLRHEVIHHLRQYGFLNEEEWSTLEAQALVGGWLSKYNIDRRYPTGSPRLKLEESIAEAYMDWSKGRDARRDRATEIAQVPSPLDAIFEKMKAFFDGIKERIGQLLGKDPTWEDIFKKVETGEVGGREGTEPLDVRAFNEKLSTPDRDPLPPPEDGKIRYYHGTTHDDASQFSGETFVTPQYNYARDYHGNKNNVLYTDLTKQEAIDRNLYDEVNDIPQNGSIQDGKARLKNVAPSQVAPEPIREAPEGGSRVFERAAALGMTTDQFKAYDKLIQARHAEDITEATKRATEEQAREHTKQWKEDRKALRQEVAATIRQRPDVAADLFFGSGELYGKKVPLGSVKLDASALSDAQKAGLPRNYYGEHGLHPDDVANLFGYGSGDAMVERLVQYNQAKLQAGGMSAKDFVSRVTDIETDRQMEIKHGSLNENIVDAVREQVNGETQQNILHEETVKLGMEIGQAPLDKGSIIQGLRDAFAKMPIGSVSSASYMRAAGKAGRDAEFGHLNNDPQAAFRAKQQQYYATVIANEASKFEKEVSKFDKLTKRYGKVFDPKSGPIDAKYSLFNRNLLSKIDRPYGMSVQGMEDAIARSGFTDLGDFVKKQNELYGIAGIQLPVADFLKDPNFHKAFNEMTVDEARETMQSVKTLDRFGRDVEKVNVAGAKQERRDLINQMNKQLEDKFEPIDHGASKQVSTLRHYIAASTKPETFFGRFDGRDPNGLFTKTFVFPAAKASNYEAVLQREFSKAYGDAGKIIDPKRKIDAPFYELDKNGKRTQQKVSGFTRENLAAVIANMGNDYNWRVFAKGWDLDPDMLWKWVEQVSKPEDFERAQAVGKLFNKGKKLSDNVYDNIYGVAPENIQVRPFTMHGKNFDGWYHPIIYDPIRSNLSKLQGVDPASGGKYQDFWPSTSNAYTKRRTGNVDVISLSHDMVPVKLNQMLHDIAYREFIHETAKITRDDAFRSTVTDRYGPEYVEQIDHWINSIAGAASYNSQALAAATRLSNKVRQNVISTYIAFSPTTIEKHGLTAAKFSMQEVGHARFARVFAEVAADSFGRAVSDLFGKSPGLGDSLWNFAVKNSEELQRRDRNYKETFSGVQDTITGKSTLRERLAELGSKGVAFSDMLSAVPTWLARYREALEENGGDVGDATYQGERAVRRAHGSTAITNRSMIESGKGPLAPWMTSIYGFFGTDLQRQMEIAHDVNDAWKLGKQGEIKQAVSKIPHIASTVFTYVIWTGLVEEMVASQFTEDHRSLLSKALSSALGPLANTWVGLRDLAYGIEHGTDPDLGLLSSPLHDAARLVKDAKKPHPIGKQNAGKFVEDAITVIGDATGLGPKHIGAPIRYGMDVWTGQQKPKTPLDVYRGLATGQQALRKEGH